METIILQKEIECLQRVHHSKHFFIRNAMNESITQINLKNETLTSDSSAQPNELANIKTTVIASTNYSAVYKQSFPE